MRQFKIYYGKPTATILEVEADCFRVQENGSLVFLRRGQAALAFAAGWWTACYDKEVARDPGPNHSPEPE